VSTEERLYAAASAARKAKATFDNVTFLYKQSLASRDALDSAEASEAAARAERIKAMRSRFDALGSLTAIWRSAPGSQRAGARSTLNEKLNVALETARKAQFEMKENHDKLARLFSEGAASKREVTEAENALEAARVWLAHLTEIQNQLNLPDD
jgi:outer membrane protein TolC